jgi:hypothetical protein
MFALSQDSKLRVVVGVRYGGRDQKPEVTLSLGLGVQA